MAEQAQQVHHEFRLPLLVEPEELRWVRRVVGTYLPAWGIDAVLDDAIEVVTELLTSVHRYAGGLTAHELRITVSDRSRALPVVRQPDWEVQSGRGMLLVAGWAEATATGKDVCCGLRVGRVAA